MSRWTKFRDQLTGGSIGNMGLPSPGLSWLERKTGELFGGESKVKELQKYTISSQGARQAKKDIQQTQDYFDPEVPLMEADPAIEQERADREEERRNRRLGRAMLMTSRRPTTTKLGGVT